MSQPRKASALLINFAGYPFAMSSLMPDNGLANLAGALMAKGHRVKILDYATPAIMRRMVPIPLSQRLAQVYASFGSTSLWKKALNGLKLSFLQRDIDHHFTQVVQEIAEELVTALDREQADFVGMKLWNGDGFEGAVQIARAIKKARPKMKIFAGGPHVDFFEEIILQKYPEIDLLVHGEGEEVIADLAEHSLGQRSLETIKNLIYLKDGKVIRTERALVEDLDSLPLPVYDESVYPVMAGNEKIKIFVLDESRGCPNQCAFCTHPIKSGNRTRQKSIPRLIQEIRHLQGSYGAKVFRFAGSNTPWTLLHELSLEIVRQKIKLEFSFFGHVRGAKPEYFKEIKAAGGVAVFFGIESGDQNVLNKMHKGTTLAQIREAVTASRSAGLSTVGSFIFPAPFETEATEAESLKLIKELGFDSVPVLFPFIVRRTKWWDDPEKYNLKINNLNRYIDVFLSYKAKNLYPPRYWQKLPIRINGMGYSEFARKMEGFLKKIESQGSVTQLGDDGFLMVKMLGKTIKEFRDLVRRIHYIGAAEEIKELMEKMNRYTMGPV